MKRISISNLNHSNRESTRILMIPLSEVKGSKGKGKEKQKKEKDLFCKLQKQNKQINKCSTSVSLI